MTDLITVEVVFATAQQQEVVSVRLPAGACVAQAIQVSALTAKFPTIDLARNKVGIFGKIVRLGTRLRDGDRVEIYRPLAIDPKEIRRLRAAARKRARSTSCR